MAVNSFPEPEIFDNYNATLNAIGYAFAVVFLIECVLKLCAFKSNYFKDSWNLFDFLCVTSSVLSMVVDTFIPTLSIGPVTSVVRIFRIGRLFRMLRFAKGLNKLFNAFLMALPKLANVGILLFLLLFLYSVLGMNVFAKVRYYGPHDERAHFRSFWRVFLTLCRSMTGEAWNEVMHALSKSKQFFYGIAEVPCVDDMEVTAEWYKCFQEGGCEPNQCGNGVLAQIYFTTFIAVVAFICLNLVIAVVLEAFDEASASDQQENIATCMTLWTEYDPNYEMEITTKAAISFLKRIMKDVEDVQEAERKRRESFMENPKPKAAPRKPKEPGFADLPIKIATFVNLPVTADHRVHFIHLVKGSLRLMIAMSSGPEETAERMAEINKVDEQFMKTLKGKQTKHLGPLAKSISDDLQALEVHVAAAKIQGLFQARRERRAAEARRKPPEPPVVEEIPKPPEVQRAG